LARRGREGTAAPDFIRTEKHLIELATNGAPLATCVAQLPR
jgi:hypothetical protein